MSLFRTAAFSLAALAGNAAGARIAKQKETIIAGVPVLKYEGTYNGESLGEFGAEQGAIDSQINASREGVKCPGVVAHEHEWSGWSAVFHVGEYTMYGAQRLGFKNDAMSSIDIPDGCQVLLYQHGFFSGWSRRLWPGRHSFLSGAFPNDDASSLKVLGVPAEVAGSWVKELTIPSEAVFVVKEGWSETKTSAYAEDTVVSISAGFEAPVLGGSVSFESSISRSISRRTETSVKTTSEKTRTTTFKNEDGGYLWSWRWAVPEGRGAGYVWTSWKVQADTRPRCLPGENRDSDYLVCNPGFCLERCDSSAPFQVLDFVIHTATNRVGQITTHNAAYDRPWFVEFQSGSPSSKWCESGELTLHE